MEIRIPLWVRLSSFSGEFASSLKPDTTYLLLRGAKRQTRFTPENFLLPCVNRALIAAH